MTNFIPTYLKLAFMTRTMKIYLKKPHI